MMSDHAIKVESLYKKYSRNAHDHLSYGLSDLLREMTGSRTRDLRKDEFYAVNDVSFELTPGDSFALIGRNGSGKTTVLKMLNGLIKPDGGRITMAGRVQALINLGAGFSPRLSGRENIFNSASLMGLSHQETSELLDAIIDFSELEDFIDSPVGTYSSGMNARLGFSVAVHLQPDILLIDEVLAVGDFAFQNKCFLRMEELKRQGITIVFVSHSNAAVIKLCKQAAWIHEGCIRAMGPSLETVQAYMDFIEKEEMNQQLKSKKKVVSLPPEPKTEDPKPLEDEPSIVSEEDPSLKVGISEPKVKESEIVLSSMQDHFILSGWYIASSEKKVELLVNDSPMSFSFLDRPDVLKIHPDAKVGLGFHAKIHRDTLQAENSVVLKIDNKHYWSRTVIVENPATAEENKPRDSIYGPIHPGTGDVDQIECRIVVDNKETNVIPIHSAVTVQFSFRLKREVQGLKSTLNIHRKDGLRVAAIATMTDGRLEHVHHGKVTCEVHIEDFDFVPGPYVIVMPISEGQGYLWRGIVQEFYVEGGGRLYWGIKDIQHTYDIRVE